MSRPPVPLPSIRDIFPEMSIQGSALSKHPSQVSATARTTVSQRRDDKPHFHLHQPPPSPPPSSSSSESATRPQHPSPTSKPPACSFNVLRADPVTSSLEHIATSTTLRPRASSTSSPHPGMHGAAPVFRVAMTPAEPRSTRHRPHRPVREILPDTRERHHSRDTLPPSIPREADLPHLRSPTSAILSFPVSDHPLSASPLITTDGRRVHLRSEIPGAALQGEGRGKKHQCPHCGKRFNRPSSMKIHVNTHTGAKPYRCPFPGCGREFNVNSNMRRHWRNHSRSAPVRLLDPDVGPSGVYHLPHHPRMDGLSHHALMSPPATNSSVSEGNSDDDAYSDEDDAMDVDDSPRPPETAPPHTTAMPASTSSDDSAWSRSVSPARGPVSPSGYSHGHGPQLHRHAPANSNPPHEDQQGHLPPTPSHGHGHSHSHSHGSHGHGQSACIYRPSIPAYAISCTDSRVSTALRPAFTSSSSSSGSREREREREHVRDRDRERERDRYYRGVSARESPREKRPAPYASRG